MSKRPEALTTFELFRLINNNLQVGLAQWERLVRPHKKEKLALALKAQAQLLSVAGQAWADEVIRDGEQG